MTLPGRMRLRPLAGCALVIAALLCGGWADTWKGIRAAAGTVTSIRADFVQEKHLKMLLHPLVSRGVLYYRAPGDLRWEYKTPVRSVMLMDGGKGRRFIESGGRLKEAQGGGMDAMPVVMEEITGWLGGRFDQSGLFSARLEPGKKIVLTPKDQTLAGIISRIELVLADRAGVMESVYIYESEDSYTRLIFSHTEINPALSDDIFRKIS